MYYDYIMTLLSKYVPSVRAVYKKK